MIIEWVKKEGATYKLLGKLLSQDVRF